MLSCRLKLIKKTIYSLQQNQIDFIFPLLINVNNLIIAVHLHTVKFIFKKMVHEESRIRAANLLAVSIPGPVTPTWSLFSDVIE